ncbi:hypothetical protein [uncultured Sulfitobacter sp.]|uniref:hypothetical protein n=1 Tax=uncultured Sulfitobacter sp. TaxID=191468 RepID=UPI0026144ECE|nr:hypothetical protein [uncultured Sulfitobacter sp.]
MIRTLLIVGLLATTGASEASARSLVGKWDCNGRDGKNLAIRMLLDYRQSGQFYHLANIAVGDRRGRIDGSVALNGKWFRNHSKLSETVKHARVRSLTANGQDISKTPVGRHMTRSLPKRMVSGNRPDVTNVRFLSNSKVKLTSGRMTATCTKR